MKMKPLWSTKYAGGRGSALVYEDEAYFVGGKPLVLGGVLPQCPGCELGCVPDEPLDVTGWSGRVEILAIKFTEDRTYALVSYDGKMFSDSAIIRDGYAHALSRTRVGTATFPTNWYRENAWRGKLTKWGPGIAGYARLRELQKLQEKAEEEVGLNQAKEARGERRSKESDGLGDDEFARVFQNIASKGG